MNSAKDASTIHKPFVEHVHELRKRLMWVVLFVTIFGGAAYSVHQRLLNILQKPLGQTLYYTSPTGGFSFLFKVCLVAGFILALPVVLYHLFEFMGPLLKRKARFIIVKYTLCSFLLAYAGMLFAYFVSLPAALHFLTRIGGTGIKSLIGVDEYFNFALAYVGGFALLFQLPLIVLFINRIKPLSPKKMMSTERYVIVISFIVAAVLTPTPDPLNQTIMALPIILLYQVSIGLVWFVNRRSKRKAATTPKIAAPRGPVQNALPTPAPQTAARIPTLALASAAKAQKPALATRASTRYINDIRPAHRHRPTAPAPKRKPIRSNRPPVYAASPGPRRFISDILTVPSPAQQ
ncbi:MAG: twin-arginine translocase subunit TatC [Candidatus Saccharimonadales bacterium]